METLVAGWKALIREPLAIVLALALTGITAGAPAQAADGAGTRGVLLDGIENPTAGDRMLADTAVAAYRNFLRVQGWVGSLCLVAERERREVEERGTEGFERAAELRADVAEVREAVDFLRFYASEARRQFTRPLPLPGPTGEQNELRLHGRGVIAAIVKTCRLL